MIYEMIGSEADKRKLILKWINSQRHKLLWEILFANHKSGMSGVFCDLRSLVLSENVLAH